MNKKDSDHENRKKVILKLAKLQGIAAEKFDDLPEDFIEFCSYIEYINLVRPLLTIDRFNEGLSYGQLAIKYGLSKKQVEYHFCCAQKFIIND